MNATSDQCRRTGAKKVILGRTISKTVARNAARGTQHRKRINLARSVKPAIVLPKWAPPECNKYQASASDVAGIFPSESGASYTCNIRMDACTVGGQKEPLGEVSLPIGKCLSIDPRADPAGNKHLVLNVGCFVSCAAWCRKAFHRKKNDSKLWFALALGVHDRSMPIFRVNGANSGTASIQLWRVSLDMSICQLQFAIAHQGGCTRMCKWLEPSRTNERLGLLHAVLGDGSLNCYSIPLAPFVQSTEPARILWRIPPTWAALPKPRRFCCFDAKPGIDDGTCMVAGGSDNAVVCVWKCLASSETPGAHDDPIAIMHTYFPDDAAVWSLAWASHRDPHTIAAGMGNGYILLWDVRNPLTPLYSHFTQIHSPIWDILWISSATVCLYQSEGLIVDLAGRRSKRLRPGVTRSLVGWGQSCVGITRLRSGVASVWGDGVMCWDPLQGDRRRYAASHSCLALWRYLYRNGRFVAKNADPTMGVQNATKQFEEGEPKKRRGRPPSEAKSADVSCWQVPGKMGAERRVAIAEEFISTQAFKVMSLRTWEISGEEAAGPSTTSRTPQHLSITLHDEGLANGSQNARLKELSGDQRDARMPLSAIAALHARCGGTSKKEPWLLASCSAGGIVHICEIPE